MVDYELRTQVLYDFERRGFVKRLVEGLKRSDDPHAAAIHEGHLVVLTRTTQIDVGFDDMVRQYAESYVYLDSDPDFETMKARYLP